MKRVIVGGLAAALVIAGGVGVAATWDRHDDAPTPRARTPEASASPAVVSMAGYPLPQDPQSAIEFRSDYMFEATVSRPPQAARTIEANAETGAPMLVYLPISLRVTRVYRGELRPGDQVFLRDLGGTAADGTTLNYGNGWPDSTWKAGVQLFIFSQHSVALAGQEAITPNMVFVEDNGVVRSALGGHLPTMPIEQMRDKVSARWR